MSIHGLWDKYKKKCCYILAAAILSALLSHYFSVFLAIIKETRKIVYNPFLFSSFTSRYGFPSHLFRILFVINLCLSAYTLIRFFRNVDAVDGERNFRYSKSGLYGTARELTEKDMANLAKAEPIKVAKGAILGQLDQTGNRVINMLPKTRINKHTLIFGASQSGKTFCYVLPFALQAARRRESLIVTDPKGELYEQTSEYFRKQGYVVRRFDLKDPTLSDGWDCLKEVVNSDTTPQDRAAIFADIVIQNTKATQGSSGGIYDDGPKLLLQALLLRAALDPELIEKGKHSVVDGNHIGQCIEYLKNEGGADYITNEVFGPHVPPEAQSSIITYKSFQQASPNLYGNLVTGLAARLGVFDSDTVKILTGTDDIDLTLPGKVPCVYYVIMSDMHRTLNFLGALFFSFLFLDLVEFADAQPDKKCPVPVNFLLDEFANIGSIPDFDQKMAVIRSRALNVSIILQDINQLANRYPHTYKSIMSNCATHLCIGFNDPDTQEYYRRRAGEITTEVRTDQHAEYESLFQFGHKHSTGAGRRDLFSSDELARIDQDQCLICWQGKNVMKAYKFPVTTHPEYKYSNALNISAKDYPKIYDFEAKEASREKERRFLAQYAAWLKDHPGDYLHFVKEATKNRFDKKSGNTADDAVDLSEDDFVDDTTKTEESPSPFDSPQAGDAFSAFQPSFDEDVSPFDQPEPDIEPVYGSDSLPFDVQAPCDDPYAGTAPFDAAPDRFPQGDNIGAAMVNDIASITSDFQLETGMGSKAEEE